MGRNHRADKRAGVRVRRVGVNPNEMDYEIVLKLWPRFKGGGRSQTVRDGWYVSSGVEVDGRGPTYTLTDWAPAENGPAPWLLARVIKDRLVRTNHAISVQDIWEE